MPIEKNKNRQIVELCSKLPLHIAACVRNSLTNNNRNLLGYDRELKTIALEVHFLSPLAYRYLKPYFNWPSPRTLTQFIQSWPRSPGCTYSSIKTLELRSRGFTSDQKYVSICCDEMSLKTHLQYDRYRDLIVGLEDYGDENRTSRIASSVLTLVVQDIGGEPWSQPLAYFFVHKSCKGDVLKQYVFEVVSQLQGIGLHPCRFVCDQRSNFVHFARIVGVTEDRPFFIVNGEEIVFFYDSPHLIKSARNCLQNTKNLVSFNGRLAKWSDIIHFHEQDAQQSIRCAPKITSAHLRPTTFEKMSVHLATQVFSNTVASAMFALYSSGNLNISKSPTFLI